MRSDAAAAPPSADYLRLLVDLGQAFSEAVPDYDALLRTVAGRVAAATGAACTIRLLADDGRWLTPAAVDHPDPALRDALRAYLRVTPERIDGGFWGPVIAERRTVRLALDPGTPPPGASAAQAAFLRAHAARALLGVPLVARGRVLGGLTLLRFGAGDPFTAADEDFLRALADRAALALDNADLYRQARASEARFRGLAELSPDGILLIQGDRYVYANPAAARLWGVADPAAILGTSPYARIPPADHARARARLARVLAGETLAPTTYALLRPDGGRVTVEASAGPAIWDGAPAAQQLCRDATARLAAEAALRASEERYRTMVEAAPIGIASHDAAGYQTGANPAWLRMLGYPPEALPDLTVERITHPDDVPRHLALFGELASGARDRIALEKRYRRADGGLVWGRLTAAAVRDADGQLHQTVSMVEDITERRAAEAALREAHEFRARILESTITAIAAFDRQGRFALVNRRVSEITGYPADELLGRTPDFLTPPEQWADTAGLLSEALGAGVPATRYGVEVRRKDGTARWVNLGLAPLLADGAIVGAVGTAEDVTALWEAETALRRSEERYRALFEQASDPIFIMADDGTILDLNAQVCRVLGYAREELVGQGSAVPIVTTPESLAATRTALLSGADLRVERDLRRKDGTTLPVEIVARALGDGRILAIARDVSERRRAEAALRASEARLRSVLDHSFDIIYRFNLATGRYDYLSAAFERMVGRSSEEALTLTPEEQAAWIHPDDLPTVQTAWENLPETGVAEYDFRFRNAGGEYRWVTAHVAEIRDAAGQPRYRDGTIRDITERVRAEAQLRALTAQLLRAQDEERRRIARDLHDLTAQDLFALMLTLARLRRLVPAANRAAQDLLAEGHALGERVLGDLRTQSYLLHPPLLEELGLASALDWYVDGFGQRSGIAVALAIDGALDRLPSEVEIVLFRVVQEALTNIHRHAGSLTASITLAREHGAVVLRIADQGRGMPQPRAGEDAVRTLGVGIPGMRERLRQLGGQLAITSSERGAVVIATVPENEGGKPPSPA